MKHIVAVCRTLSDRDRLRIVATLVTHDELCACQLTDMLAVRGATASRHLGVLLGCGLIARRKAGRWANYRLAEKDPAAGESGQVLAWLKAEFGSSRCGRSPDAVRKSSAGSIAARNQQKSKKPAEGGEKDNG